MTNKYDDSYCNLQELSATFKLSMAEKKTILMLLPCCVCRCVTAMPVEMHRPLYKRTQETQCQQLR